MVGCLLQKRRDRKSYQPSDRHRYVVSQVKASSPCKWWKTRCGFPPYGGWWFSDGCIKDVGRIQERSEQSAGDAADAKPVHCLVNAPYGGLAFETTTALALLSLFLLCFLLFTPKPSGHTTRPISRPSAGVVEGVERQGCRESREGHGWPFVAGPWNGTGAREPRQRRGRMQGQAVLVTFAATGKSDAPCWAQSVVRAEESAASKTPDHEAKRQKHRQQAGSYGASQHSAPRKAQSVVRAEESAAFETPDPHSQKTKHRPQAGSYQFFQAFTPCRAQAVVRAEGSAASYLATPSPGSSRAKYSSST